MRRVRSALEDNGYLDTPERDEENRPLGLVTRELDNSIRSFQRDHDLKKDGRLNPGGETETTLTQTAQQKQQDGVRAWRERLAPPPKPQKKPEDDHTAPIPKRKPEVISPTRKGDELLDFIGKLESSDNYNVIYGHKIKPLTKMTVKEVQRLQKEMYDNGSASTAIGRYQIKRSTLKETIDKLGINENALFDEKLQDQLARQLLKKRGFEKYKAGKISTDALIKELANEWAALPPDASNKSRYEGTLNNRALTTYQTLKDLLEKK